MYVDRHLQQVKSFKSNAIYRRSTASVYQLHLPHFTAYCNMTFNISLSPKNLKLIGNNCTSLVQIFKVTALQNA